MDSNRKSAIDEFIATILNCANRISVPKVEDILDVYTISSLVIVLLSAYVLYYLLCAVKKPIVHSNERWKRFLLSHCPILLENYCPTIWCLEARIQTIVYYLLLRSPNIKYNREILKLSDGGQLGLDWAVDGKQSINYDNTQPVVIILPGLTGSSELAYVQHWVKECVRLRYRCVVMNYRGMGGVPVSTPRTYCGANTDDLHEVVESVARMYPHCPIMAVGISLGGTILNNYLAEKGKSSRLLAGMSISPIFSCLTTGQFQTRGINYLFNLYLGYYLRASVKPHESMFRNVCDMEHVYKSWTIEDFDERFTVPVFGYKDLNEYYAAATNDHKLHKIKVPLLCLFAEDDNFYPGKYLPIDEVTQSSDVMLVVTPRGGHIAFFEGFLIPNSVGYMHQLFKQFSEAILKRSHAIKPASSYAQFFLNQPIGTASQPTQKLVANQNGFH